MLETSNGFSTFTKYLPNIFQNFCRMPAHNRDHAAHDCDLKKLAVAFEARLVTSVSRSWAPQSASVIRQPVDHKLKQVSHDRDERSWALQNVNHEHITIVMLDRERPRVSKLDRHGSRWICPDRDHLYHDRDECITIVRTARDKVSWSLILLALTFELALID